MGEWSEDPVEMRYSCLHQSRKINKGKGLDVIMQGAREIESFIKEAKPKARRLKMINRRKNKKK
jgi:hypothetical protein